MAHCIIILASDRDKNREAVEAVVTKRSELFRARLQDELQKRVKAHGKYSFRAFAHSLKIDPSSLHDIMKGERAVGEKLIRRLGEKIGMTLAEIEQLLNPTAPE